LRLLERDLALAKDGTLPIHPAADKLTPIADLARQLLAGLIPLPAVTNPRVELYQLRERRLTLGEAIRRANQRLAQLKGQADRAILVNGYGDAWQRLPEEKVLLAARLQGVNVKLEKLRREHGGLTPSDPVRDRAVPQSLTAR
jgi:hypothetical protein